MTNSIVVSPTNANSTHHIKLTDGITSLGFTLRSGNRTDARAITRRPRQNGQYSPFTQNDWGGGRGIKDAQADRSRFADSKRAITRHPGAVMIGGQETYTTGFRQAEQYLPGKLTWQSLLTTERYVAYKFTASASGNREKIYLWIRRRGTPTSTLTVELCSDSAGNPDTVLKTVTKTTTDITDTISELVEFSFSSVQAVTSTTSYWVKVYTSTADSTTDYWQVGTDAARTNALTKCSSDNGSTDAWAAAAYDLYFRIVDDTDQLGGLFFNYKGQLYFLTRPSGSSAPKLYINGDRGVATGAQSTTTLKDTTKSWTTNAFAGAIVFIFSGTNSEWQTPYRTIVSNTSDTLTFSPAFPKACVAGNTVYTILGSNSWTEITGHGLTVLPTDTTNAGEVMYFAQGDSTAIRSMREYVNANVWTREFAGETNFATFMLSYKHPTKGIVVCKANNVGPSGDPVFAQAKFEGWGRRLGWPAILNDCEATTGWTAGANCAIATDSADFVSGVNSLKFTMSGTPASPSWYFTNTSWFGANKFDSIQFWLKASTNMSAGELKVFISTSATAASQIELLTVPAVSAGVWTLITLPYNATLAGTENALSVGFIATSSTNVYHIDMLKLSVSGSEVPLGNKGEKITGMERYGDPEVPWVFRTQSAGSIENGTFNPIPLRELSTAENVHNGVGHTVHNVYLYFSFLHGMERFYRNNLDDIGPNRDEGLPDNRRGFITSMTGYIGRFFENYDVQEGYSCIMESTSGGDHHEVYRCDTAGSRIRNIFVQVIPGDTADRLWFTQGDDICWLPLPGNTLKENTDDTFRHTHEAVLETGWILGGEQDAIKLFHSVKLFTENVTANRKIEWDYMTDDNSTWVPVSTSFTAVPVQDIAINISANRIKFRFRLQTNDNTETPIIRAMIVSATTRPETRYTYSMTTTLDDAGIDLRGQQDTSMTAETTLGILDGWMENNTILTMSSVFSPFHNKQVFLEPTVTQPLSIVLDESKEKLSATIILVEP